MLALYRKYRPKNFSEVVGQEHVVTILKNALLYNKVAHAYLFCGPKGTGKTTLARLLAKAVNCEKRGEKFEPCNKCSSCTEINEGRSLDLLEIDAASNRGINEIRDLREKIKFVPAKTKFKVFIIDEVHMLTIEAFNALLKTLEEPPRHCIFILATTAVHKVPMTILSRCQRFDFRRLLQKEIESQLSKIAKEEKINVEKEALRLVASEASGSSRDALSIFGQIITLEDKEIRAKEVKDILGLSPFSDIAEFTDFVIKKDTRAAVAQINEMAESGKDLSQFLKELLEYLRKLLLLKVDLNFDKTLEFNMTDEELHLAKKQSQNIKEGDLTKLLSLLIKAKKEAESTVLPQLLFELAVLEALSTRDQTKMLTNGGSRQAAYYQKTQSEDVQRNEDPIHAVNKNSFDTKITLFDVKKKWQDIKKAVQEKNFPLSAFLRSCVPYEFKNGELYIACRFTFHKERIEDIKNKKVLEDTLAEIMQEKVLVKCRMISDIPKKKPRLETLGNKTESFFEQDDVLPSRKSNLKESLELVEGPSREEPASLKKIPVKEGDLINLASEVFGDEK